MQGGEVWGALANAPTFGARMQSTTLLVVVVARVCSLLRLADAWDVYAAATTGAAATKVNLVIGFLQMVLEAEEA
jgi:hypothetical protein